MGVIDGERDTAAEFSDLYMRLLNAALDEINSSLLPRMRERNLAVHVARGISMAGCLSDRDQGLGREELCTEEPCRAFVAVHSQLYPQSLRPTFLFETNDVAPGATVHPARLASARLTSSGAKATSPPTLSDKS